MIAKTSIYVKEKILSYLQNRYTEYTKKVSLVCADKRLIES